MAMKTTGRPANFFSSSRTSRVCREERREGGREGGREREEAKVSSEIGPRPTDQPESFERSFAVVWARTQ